MSEVQLVEVKYMAPKEMHEVREAIMGLIKAAVAKKPLTEVAVSEWSRLQAAIDGVQTLPEEAKEKMGEMLEASGHFAGQIVRAVMGK